MSVIVKGICRTCGKTRLLHDQYPVGMCEECLEWVFFRHVFHLDFEEIERLVAALKSLREVKREKEAAR